MLLDYIWEICFYDRWGRQRDLSFDGVSMFLRNLSAGKELYPLANVHVHWGKLQLAWEQLSEAQKEAAETVVREVLSAKRHDLYALCDSGDRDGLCAILSSRCSDPQGVSVAPISPPSPASKPKRPRKKRKGV